MNNIIEKVGKLLNVADPRSGATEGEMATAMAHANAFMIKHNIEQADTAIVTEETTIAYIRDDNVLEEYHHTAACAAALLNMCKPLRMTENKMWGFIGLESNTKAAAMMFTYIVEQVDKAYRLHLPKKLSKTDRANFRRSFKQACAGRVLCRAIDIIAVLSTDNNAAQAAVGKNALVVQSTIKQRLEEADEYAKSKFKMKKIPVKRTSVGLGSLA